MDDKRNLYLQILAFAFFMGMVFSANAQFLKKLKDKLKGEDTPVLSEKVSDGKMQFADWDQGQAEIIAISVFSDDFEKHRFSAGTIAPDGSFSINLPESVQTWLPLSVYGQDCSNSQTAEVVNPDAKMAWNRFFVFRNGEYLGYIIPANPVKAAYNLNDGGVNNGRIGKYYLHVYVDQAASAVIDCEKMQDITDGQGARYEDFPLKDHFDLDYQQGWNLVEVDVRDNIWVGLTKHYTERAWKVVEDLPDGTRWVFRPSDP